MTQEMIQKMTLLRIAISTLEDLDASQDDYSRTWNYKQWTVPDITKGLEQAFPEYKQIS
jgi:hypothetical protein